MLMIHCLVGGSHFAQPLIIREMLINLLKFRIPQKQGKWKSDPESVSGTASPAKVNQFFRLAIIRPFFLSSFLSYLGWYTLPLHASAEACLTGWPNAQPQGRD